MAVTLGPLFPGGSGRHANQVTATTQGLPAGATTTLTITTRHRSVDILLVSQGHCSGSGRGVVTCQVNAAQPTVHWTFIHPSQSADLTVSVASTYSLNGVSHDDADPSNNSWSSS